MKCQLWGLSKDQLGRRSGMSALPLEADILRVGIDVRQVPKADVSTCSTAIDGAGGTSRGLEVHLIMQTRRKRCAMLITSPVGHHNRHR